MAASFVVQVHLITVSFVVLVLFVCSKMVGSFVALVHLNCSKMTVSFVVQCIWIVPRWWGHL